MAYVKTYLPTLKTHVVNLKRDAKNLSRDLQRLEVRGKLESKTLYLCQLAYLGLHQHLATSWLNDKLKKPCTYILYYLSLNKAFQR